MMDRPVDAASAAAPIPSASVDPAQPAWKRQTLSAHALFVALPVRFPVEAIGVPLEPAWTREWERIAEDHCAHLAVPVRKISKANALMAWLTHDHAARLMSAAWLPRKAKPPTDTPVDRDPPTTWQRDEQGPSLDLHPFIRKIFGYASPPSHDASVSPAAGARRFEGVPTLTMGPAATQALQGGYGRKGAGFDLALSPAACTRTGLAKGSTLGIRIRSVRLQLFTSGYALVVFEMELTGTTPTAELLLEAGHLLEVNAARTRTVGMAWRQADEPDLHCPTLSEITRQLLPIAGIEHLHEQQSRFFTYTFAKTAASLPAASVDELAARLACRFTEHYDLGVPDGVVSLYRPFGEFVHAMSSEGGSVVIAGHDDVPFLRDFLGGPLRRVYLPLALLAYHEHLYLLGMAQDVSLQGSYRVDDHRGADRLGRLSHLLVQFHVDFRFSVPSVISLHNQTHRIWRDALRLDRLLDDVARDVEKNESAYKARIRDRYRWVAPVASSAALVFALMQSGEYVLAHIYNDDASKGLFKAGAMINVDKEAERRDKDEIAKAFEKRMDEKDAWELGLMLVSLGVGFGAFRYLWRRPG